MDVRHINPFISSASNVFDTMLDCRISRTGLSLKDGHSPSHPISGIIGLSGTVCGSVVLSLSREVAFGVVDRMLGLKVNEVDSNVVDATGELTNIIAGGAKAQLSQYQLSLGLPNVVVGRNHTICFPTDVSPLCIDFDTPWGPIALEVGLGDPNRKATFRSQ